jgi:hypothetical protein
MADTPLVRRPVHTGGVLLLVAALQFVAVAILTGTRTPSFSVGSTTLATLVAAPSPWGMLFDASVLALGALGIVALLLVWSSFDEHPNRSWGLLVLLVGGAATASAGILLIASYPLSSLAFRIARDVAIAGVGAGLITVSFAMHRPDRWRFSGPYTLTSGAIVLGAGAWLASGFHLALGAGITERLILAPALLWPIVEGVHIVRLHRFAPGLHVKIAAV